MSFPRFLCGLALATAIPTAACVAQSAQPDFLTGVTPVSPATPDPAIVHALQAIQPAHIEQTIKTLVSFGNRSTHSSMEKDLPPGQGITAAADWIAGQFEQISKDCGGCLEVHRDTFIQPVGERMPEPTTLTNIYAVMRGTDPTQAKRMVLVTGHYDSRNSNDLNDRDPAPGANDDASGVAVSLECARTLSKLHLPSTVVFVAVAGEEQGLYGSAHLAKLAKSEGWQLEAVLNNDIVGGNTTPGDTLQLKDRVRVFSEGVPVAATPDQQRRIRALGQENDSPSRELARVIADTARTYFPADSAAFTPVLIFRPDRYLRGGDHSSFNREGFAAVRFTEWREDFNHQHQNVVIPPPGSSDPIKGDLIQFVDFDYIAKVARLNAATLATLASAPGAPVKLAIETKSLDNGSTLTWEPPAGAGPDVHYDLLWRETSAPDWQYVQTVAASPANASTVTERVPISKDNVIFGVRSVDAAGHRSLVAVP